MRTQQIFSCFWVYWCSVAWSCPTLWEPMDRSMPGFLVLYCVLEFTQIHVHWVGDAIQPSHPLLPSSPALSLSQHQGLSPWVSSCRRPEFGHFLLIETVLSGRADVMSCLWLFPGLVLVWDSWLCSFMRAVLLEPDSMKAIKHDFSSEWLNCVNSLSRNYISY